MLHELVEVKGGKEKVLMTDALTKVNARLRTLRSSSRGRKVTFFIRASESTDKFKQKPTRYDVSGGGRAEPKRVK